MWSGVPVINGGFPVHSVSCTSFSFCVAVGGWSFAGADGIEFNGNTWSQPQELDPMKALTSVSCATTTYCVAVGPAGAYLFDGLQWSVLPGISGLDGFLTSVSCVSPSFCMAIGNVQGSSQSTTAYVLDGTTWAQSVQVSTSLNYMAVSCHSAVWCMAVGAGAELWDGNVWRQVEPPVQGSGNWLTVVSCPDASTCIAMDTTGNAWTFDGVGWTSESVFSNLTSSSISCVSATSCVVADAHGNIATFDGTSWTNGPTPLDPVSGTEGGPYLALACSDSTFCAAVDDGGNVWYDNFGTWTTSARQLIDNAALSLSCVSQSFCMAVDTNGDYLTFDGSTWTAPAPTIPYEIHLDSVSCVSADFCIATDYAGQTLAYNGSGWSASGSFGNGSSAQVSCTSATFCLAVGGTEAMTFDGTQWSAPMPVSAVGLLTVSCSSPKFCAAFDNGGNAYTFNGAIWNDEPSIVSPSGNNLVPSVSCPSDGFCVAVDAAGDGITYEGGGWNVHSGVDTVHGYLTGLDAISCSSPTFCVGVGYLGSSVDFDGSVWTMGQTSGSDTTNTVSCPTTTFCQTAETNGVVHTLYVDTTSVSASTNVPAATVGQAVTYTAAVTADESAIAAAPNRNVTFSVGSAVLCRATLVASTAQCHSTSAPAGNDQVVAAYSGDINFRASQTTVPLVVTKPPSITSRSTATFVKGKANTFDVTAHGYPKQVQFTETGTLPSGVTLTSAGVLSGTPTAIGGYSFTITASNGVVPNATQGFTLKVAKIKIATFSLGVATRGSPYSLQLTELGGVPPFTWAVTSPALPAGLSMTTAGRITGTVQSTVATGAHSVGISLHDSATPTHHVAIATLTITVN
jgi:hypothetical protein